MAVAGDRIGPFELDHRVEAEGGAELWHARRVDNKLREAQEVALRLAAGPRDPEAVEAVRQEYVALRGLEDPRFPKVVGYFAGAAALALEWVEGWTLAELLAAARSGQVTLDQPTALELSLELAQALRSAHAASDGVRVHGWLRPDQVMLRPDGELVVLGLGRQPPEWDTRYLPPECIEGWPEDPRVDQWLHGAILYELLTLRPVYEDHDGGGPLVRGDPEEQLRALDHALPEAARVLRKALASAPARRYASDADWLLALHALLRAVGGSSSRRELPDALRAARAGRQPVAESAAIAATASLLHEPRLASGPSLQLVQVPEEERTDPKVKLSRSPSSPTPSISLGLSVALPAEDLPQAPQASLSETPSVEPTPVLVSTSLETVAPPSPQPPPAPVDPDDAPLEPPLPTYERVAWVAVGVLALVAMLVAARVLL